MEMIKGMPDAEYHDLKRLSTSGIKKLLTSAQDFWTWSWFNVDKEPYESTSLNTGKAYHKYCLDGADAFHAAYAVAPECDKRTTAGKAIYAEWKAANPSAEAIDQRLLEQITACNAANLFKDGEPEVTFLWNDAETNVPMKARLDYLTGTHILDLKTFSNSSDMDINRLIANHIVKYKYHIQAAVYGSLFPDRTFRFVFQQTGQANNCIVRDFPKDLLLYQRGVDNMRQGINKFAEMYRKFGDRPWFDDFGQDNFTDESFPIWSLE